MSHRVNLQVQYVKVSETLIKDLSMIGRDLAKCIIVDNIPQNFRLQKENGIFIKSFYSDNKNDDSLIQLAPILKSKIDRLSVRNYHNKSIRY
ncbi:MAG: HAD family hydrolase [Flammeovirgaceae bacterium]